MLYTTLIDYFATGEGRTLYFLAANCKDRAAFEIFILRNVPAYYAEIAQIYDGLPPDKNGRPLDFLVSPALYAFLENQEQKADCHLEIVLHCHYNFS